MRESAPGTIGRDKAANKKKPPMCPDEKTRPRPAAAAVAAGENGPDGYQGKEEGSRRGPRRGGRGLVPLDR